MVQVSSTPRRAAGGLKEKFQPGAVTLFLVAHVFVGLLVYTSQAASTLHAMATFALGCWWALSGKRLERVAYVVAYIMGAEVLWRMTNGSPLWEFGKYATAMILMLALIRSKRITGPFLPLAYFAFLLPSTVFIAARYDFSLARELISFYLSGPFALMVAAWFFSHLRLTEVRLYRIWVCLAAPTVSVAAVTAFHLYLHAAAAIFSGEASKVASGGFGPNQVSSVLGLGAMAVFFLLVQGGGKRWLKIVLVATLGALLFQCGMTFSRGGLAMALGGSVVGGFFFIREPRTRVQLVLGGMLVAAVMYFVFIPTMDEMTAGQFSNRFSQTTLTHRDEIARAELYLWAQNPILGVGPGQASVYYEKVVGVNGRIGSHTEFTRMLAEHGIFGLLSVGAFVIMLLVNFASSKTRTARAVVAAFSTWAILYMLINAFRLVAPALLVGITFAKFREGRTVRVVRVDAEAESPGAAG